MATLKLTLGATDYEADLDGLLKLSIGEARTIKRETGLTIMGWCDGLLAFDRQDPDVLAGLLFLLKSRAGETVDWADLNEVPVEQFWAGLSAGKSPDTTSETEVAPRSGDDGSTSESVTGTSDKPVTV